MAKLENVPGCGKGTPSPAVADSEDDFGVMLSKSYGRFGPLETIKIYYIISYLSLE